LKILALCDKILLYILGGISMIDIKFLRENPDLVKENIKKKFQDKKLPLVDEVISLDEENRNIKLKGDELRASRNRLSSEIGILMKNGEKDKAEEIKKQVTAINEELVENEQKEATLAEEIKIRMMKIPNMMHPSVPIGEDDSKNVEVQRYGEPVVPSYEVPYHTDIMENLCGIDLDSARRVAGNGFYYLMGDIARLHSAVISYARDFMINKGFTYCIPPFMIRSDVVTGVMSFEEMDAMMYKIEGEDLYLIGTSEHSMIGKFKGQILKEEDLPYTMTSYSPCFRKEKGAHGIEERGIYRIHQFEKQEMVVVCKPEDSYEWYDKMWSYTVELFRSMDIPVRTLECCSGDLADLKAKSVDVEAWSPRQQKYFEVGSCSNLTDAQARRLGIRIKGEKGNYYAHTLNNTVVAPPRMLIALLENNYQEDGSVKIPEVLRPYMGGIEVLKPKK
jgi:seryl-tRNA synthetase